jgi:hypothetical protein
MDCLLRKGGSSGFHPHGKSRIFISCMSAKNHLNITTHYMGESREKVLNQLLADNWGWEFKIGLLHVGSPFFKSEYPEYEIVAEYRPIVRDRKRRYAIYAKCLMGKYAN